MAEEKKINSFWSGLILGLLPHSFCIAFIVLTVIGATALTGLVRNFFLIPYFFQFLVVFSLFLATVSTIIYLRRNQICSWAGAKRKWRYLLILYGTTLSVNLVMFMIILPRVVNFNLDSPRVLSQNTQESNFVLAVDIPCSGHAALIIDELKKVNGVQDVFFTSPNHFSINYDPKLVTSDQLLGIEIFKTFKATTYSD